MTSGISDAIVEYLSDLHYAVEAVYDGQSAWDLLDVFTYDIGAARCDVARNGWELLFAISYARRVLIFQF